MFASSPISQTGALAMLLAEANGWRLVEPENRSEGRETGRTLAVFASSIGCGRICSWIVTKSPCDPIADPHQHPTNFQSAP
jgi:hypothetical protein